MLHDHTTVFRNNFPTLSNIYFWTDLLWSIQFIPHLNFLNIWSSRSLYREISLKIFAQHKNLLFQRGMNSIEKRTWAESKNKFATCLRKSGHWSTRQRNIRIISFCKQKFILYIEQQKLSQEYYCSSWFNSAV